MKHLFTLLMILPLGLLAQYPPSRASFWFVKGKQADEAHAYHEAERAYTQAIRMGYRPLRQAYLARATARARQQAYQAALDDYNKAIALDPYYAKAYANRGNTFAALGMHRRAIQDFDKAIRLGLNDARIYCLRGISLALEGEFRKALADFDQSLRIDRRYAEAYFQRGLLWQQWGYPERAAGDFEKAILYDPSDQDAKDALRRLRNQTAYQYGQPDADFAQSTPHTYQPNRGSWEEPQEKSRPAEPEPAPPTSPPVAEALDDYHIDQNLPRSRMYKPDAIAIVIGNRHYEHASEVRFAHKDASMVKKYLTQVLGFREGNVVLLEDATTSDFQVYFGTPENPQGKLYNMVKPGKSELFVYYSGHGAPDLKEKKAFFLPVDCDPNYIQLGGYSLEAFYQNLARIPATSKTVVLDACFSGINIYQNLSLVRIKTDPNRLADPNLVVLSSSTAEQPASWYNAKGQGLFTWFFLRAIQDVRHADANADGQLTLREVHAYLSDPTEGIPYYARRLHGIEQTPLLLGKDKERVLMSY